MTSRTGVSLPRSPALPAAMPAAPRQSGSDGIARCPQRALTSTRSHGLGLAAELTGTGVTANILRPGTVDTATTATGADVDTACHAIADGAGYGHRLVRPLGERAMSGTGNGSITVSSDWPEDGAVPRGGTGYRFAGGSGEGIEEVRRGAGALATPARGRRARSIRRVSIAVGSHRPWRCPCVRPRACWALLAGRAARRAAPGGGRR